MGARRLKERERLRRWCEQCDEKFMPTGTGRPKYCPDCFEQRRKKKLVLKCPYNLRKRYCDYFEANIGRSTLPLCRASNPLKCKYQPLSHKSINMSSNSFRMRKKGSVILK